MTNILETKNLKFVFTENNGKFDCVVYKKDQESKYEFFVTDCSDKKVAINQIFRIYQNRLNELSSVRNSLFDRTIELSNILDEITAVSFNELE